MRTVPVEYVLIPITSGIALLVYVFYWFMHARADVSLYLKLRRDSEVFRAQVPPRASRQDCLVAGCGTM
jgi:hypothetical protein